MKIAFVGAGAMGGSFGGLLSVAGHDVILVDTWADHVAAINETGLQVDGALGEHRVSCPAATAPKDGESADVAIVFTDANNTRAGAETAKGLIGADGFAITFQNGIGNIETLQSVIGADRVLGGSSMCSAATLEPGHVSLTHMGLTKLGELDGRESDRAKSLAAALESAGFKVALAPDIMGVIWQKFVVNCGANAIAATTGLRPAEFVRVAEIDAFQDRVLDEVMAVIEAKGIALPDPDIVARIKAGCRAKLNRPSMLQHVGAGRRTEIEALNVALVREAKTLGIATPYNDSLVALLKGRELAQIRAIHEPDLDYDAWEARIAAGEEE